MLPSYPALHPSDALLTAEPARSKPTRAPDSCQTPRRSRSVASQRPRTRLLLLEAVEPERAAKRTSAERRLEREAPPLSVEGRTAEPIPRHAWWQDLLRVYQYANTLPKAVKRPRLDRRIARSLLWAASVELSSSHAYSSPELEGW